MSVVKGFLRGLLAGIAGSRKDVEVALRAGWLLYAIGTLLLAGVCFRAHNGVSGWGLDAVRQDDPVLWIGCLLMVLVTAQVLNWRVRNQ
jgi:hypothetical protein